MIFKDCDIIALIQSFDDYDSLTSSIDDYLGCMSHSEFEFYLERSRLLFAKKIDLLCEV